MQRLALFLVLALAGCRGITVQTRDHIHVEGPVETRVIADMQPIADGGPVCPVAVPSGVGAPPAGCKEALNGPRVAIIDVDGVLLNTNFTGPFSLGENPVALFREKLDAVAADPCVKALVLRINSPGGGVAAAEQMRRDLLRFRQRTGMPAVACLLDVGAGGAYYLASACDRVVAAPGTVTGGLGVVLNLYNLRDLMAQYNVIPQEVKSGALTDIGTPARALSPEGKQLLQTMAGEFHDRLQRDILQSRPGIDLAGGTTFDGRIFTGSQALGRGLVDGVGDVDDAIALAREAAGQPNAPAALYRRRNDPARSVYAVTPNLPIQASLLPSLPGLDRARLPTFLCAWQPELSLERQSGK